MQVELISPVHETFIADISLGESSVDEVFRRFVPI